MILQELNMLLKYKEMLRITVSKELRARYKGSVLGFLWAFINPLLQLIVYSFAFKYIMKVKIPGANYTVFLFAGLTTWSCFANSLIMGSGIIVANSNLVKKIYFPRSILPISSVTGNVINMLLVFCILFPVAWISGYVPNKYYLYLPLLVIIQWMLNLGAVFILSSLFVYFRDIEHIINVMLMAWMYITPMIYSEDMIPWSMYHWLKLNPMFPIITAYQRIIIFGRSPDMYGLVYIFLFAIFILLLGYGIFMSLQRRFAEEL